MRDRSFMIAVGKELNGEKSAKDIATALGCSISSVHAAVRRMGRQDDLRMRYNVRRSGQRHDVHIPNNVNVWLARITPPGLRVDEMIRAIVTDAFNEAQEPAE